VPFAGSLQVAITYLFFQFQPNFILEQLALITLARSPNWHLRTSASWSAFYQSLLSNAPQRTTTLTVMSDLAFQRAQATVKVLSSLFSPCGRFLVAGDDSGTVNVWTLDLTFDGQQRTQTHRRDPAQAARGDAHAAWRAHDDGDDASGGGRSIYDLLFTQLDGRDVLVTAGDSDVRVWHWPEIAAAAAAAAAVAASSSSSSSCRHTSRLAVMTLAAPQEIRDMQAPEINSIAMLPSSAATPPLMVAACGDANLYVFDLAAGKHTRTLRGHGDRVYSVAVATFDANGDGRRTTQVCSSSEDGTVRMWRQGCDDDNNDGDKNNSDGEWWCCGIIDPHAERSYTVDFATRQATLCFPFDDAVPTTTTTTQAVSASAGKWLSCLDVDATGVWLAVGGGAKCLSLWYLPCLSLSARMRHQGAVQFVRVGAERVLSAGDDGAGR
jgi:WD40 repeat protein